MEHPGAASGESVPSARDACARFPRRQRPPRINLELGVLGAAQEQPGAGRDSPRRNEPPPPVCDEDKEPVAARGAEELDRSAPALVTPARADHDLPATVPEAHG